MRSGVIQPSGAKSTERVNGGRRDEKKRAGILSCTLRAVMQYVFFFSRYILSRSLCITIQQPALSSNALFITANMLLPTTSGPLVPLKSF